MVLNRWPDNFFAETEQVAFCPANVPPGIDFSNDPLLQGRLFSYLDTQLSRLGGPNFAQIPINAPKCPFHHMQRDGHMQMQVPKGRVNYEPSSLQGDTPRASLARGFRHFAQGDDGSGRGKGRIRPKALPTTTARRACSTAAKARWSRRTWRRRWCLSCRRWRHRMCARRWWASCCM